jgi:hypothetical protein
VRTRQLSAAIVVFHYLWVSGYLGECATLGEGARLGEALAWCYLGYSSEMLALGDASPGEDLLCMVF